MASKDPSGFGSLFGKITSAAKSMAGSLFGKPPSYKQDQGIAEAPKKASASSTSMSTPETPKTTPAPKSVNIPLDPPASTSKDIDKRRKDLNSFMSGEAHPTLQSSNVSMGKYDLNTENLTLGYRGRDYYGYKSITPTQAEGFQQAQSKGTWVWDNLRVRGTVHSHQDGITAYRTENPFAKFAGGGSLEDRTPPLEEQEDAPPTQIALIERPTVKESPFIDKYPSEPSPKHDEEREALKKILQSKKQKEADLEQKYQEHYKKARENYRSNSPHLATGGEIPGAGGAYYSQLGRSIEGLGDKPLPVEIIKNRLSKAGGFKEEEWQESNMDDLLEGKKQISKNELMEHFQQNQLPILEKRNTAYGPYQGYQTKGGENYQELLLRLPEKEEEVDEHGDRVHTHSSNYWSSHWSGQANVLAHMRFQDRKDEQGKNILHLEELQSDWHQEGREKGYFNIQNPYQVFNRETKEIYSQHPNWMEAGAAQKGLKSSLSKPTGDIKLDFENLKTAGQIYYAGPEREQVPGGPFKNSWHDLGMKRMLYEAASGGYDKFSINTGEQIQSLVGGKKEGMKKFYGTAEGENKDEVNKQATMLNWLRKFGKQFGVQPQQTSYPTALGSKEHPNTAHSIDITPEMREHILKNKFPLFNHGGSLETMGETGSSLGSVTPAQDAPVPRHFAEGGEYDLPQYPGKDQSELGQVPSLTNHMKGLMTGRYGAKTTGAILGAGAATSWGAFGIGLATGHPNYIPVGVATLPYIAAAEMWHQGKKLFGKDQQGFADGGSTEIRPVDPFQLNKDAEQHDEKLNVRELFQGSVAMRGPAPLPSKNPPKNAREYLNKRIFDAEHRRLQQQFGKGDYESLIQKRNEWMKGFMAPNKYDRDTDDLISGEYLSDDSILDMDYHPKYEDGMTTFDSPIPQAKILEEGTTDVGIKKFGDGGAEDGFGNNSKFQEAYNEEFQKKIYQLMEGSKGNQERLGSLKKIEDHDFVGEIRKRILGKKGISDPESSIQDLITKSLYFGKYRKKRNNFAPSIFDNFSKQDENNDLLGYWRSAISKNIAGDFRDISGNKRKKSTSDESDSIVYKPSKYDRTSDNALSEEEAAKKEAEAEEELEKVRTLRGGRQDRDKASDLDKIRLGLNKLYARRDRPQEGKSAQEVSLRELMRTTKLPKDKLKDTLKQMLSMEGNRGVTEEELKNLKGFYGKFSHGSGVYDTQDAERQPVKVMPGEVIIPREAGIGREDLNRVNEGNAPAAMAREVLNLGRTVPAKAGVGGMDSVAESLRPNDFVIRTSSVQKAFQSRADGGSVDGKVADEVNRNELKTKKYADGGEVDREKDPRFSPNMYRNARFGDLGSLGILGAYTFGGTEAAKQTATGLAAYRYGGLPALLTMGLTGGFSRHNTGENLLERIGGGGGGDRIPSGDGGLKDAADELKQAAGELKKAAESFSGGSYNRKSRSRKNAEDAPVDPIPSSEDGEDPRSLLGTYDLHEYNPYLAKKSSRDEPLPPLDIEEPEPVSFTFPFADIDKGDSSNPLFTPTEERYKLARAKKDKAEKAAKEVAFPPNEVYQDFIPKADQSSAPMREMFGPPKPLDIYTPIENKREKEREMYGPPRPVETYKTSQVFNTDQENAKFGSPFGDWASPERGTNSKKYEPSRTANKAEMSLLQDGEAGGFNAAAITGPAALFAVIAAEWLGKAIHAYLKGVGIASDPSAFIKGSVSSVEGQVGKYNPGGVERFNLALDNLSASLGRIFEPVILSAEQLANELNVLYTSVGPEFRETVAMIAGPIKELAGDVFLQLIESIRDVVQTLSPVFDDLKFIKEEAKDTFTILFSIVRDGAELFSSLWPIIKYSMYAVKFSFDLFLTSIEMVTRGLSYLGNILTGRWDRVIPRGAGEDLVNRRATPIDRTGGMTFAAQPARFIGIEDVGLNARQSAYGQGNIQQGILEAAQTQVQEARKMNSNMAILLSLVALCDLSGISRFVVANQAENT